MTTVAVGFLGTTLDRGRGGDRWSKWRPTVALCQQPDLVIDRLELLVGPNEAAAALAEQVKADIATVSPETEVVLHPFQVEDLWDFEGVYAALHDWARQYAFAPEDDDYLVHITTGTHVAQIVLFLLTESRRLPGRLIQTAPARRVRGGAPGRYAIIDLDLDRYDQIARRFASEREEGESLLKSGIATRNAEFNRLIEQLERVVLRTRDPILLTGPTGAGKSQLARRIFELKSARRQVTGEFVELNCATLHGTSAMSALFGHVKGAFTGATTDRAGLLRAADGGVLFLDEIGELGMDEQAMLLRALEEKRFLPFGSDREVSSRFQLLAGTHRDLVADVAAGRFREDLLARINLWTFRLPGLRERPEDIAPNFEYEVERVAERTGERVTFNRAAREAFLEFAITPEAAWRANFRDLNAAVVRMATLCRGGRVTSGDVAEEVKRLRAAWASGEERERSSVGEAAVLRDVLGDAVDELDRFEAVQLADVIGVCRESASMAEAGRRLFAASRRRKRSGNDSDRLRKYLMKFGLTWTAVTRSV